jgi:hypothetical protein
MHVLRFGECGPIRNLRDLRTTSIQLATARNGAEIFGGDHRRLFS